MAAALLLIAVANGCGDGSSDPQPRSQLEKKAEQAEQRLRGKPSDTRFLLATMGAWIAAGNDWLSKVNTREQPVPSTASEDYEAGLRAWNDYLKQTRGEAQVDDAEQAGGTYFKLVEIGSTDPDEAEANAAGAAKAQKIAVKHEPSLYTLSNLAIYEYFNDEIAAGNRAAHEAAAGLPRVGANGSIGRRDVIGQLNEYRERGEKFVARVRRGAKELAESGEEELETPIKGYGAPSGINGYEPE